MKLARLLGMRRETGPAERIDRSSPWWGEHMARYAYVSELVRDRIVLDVACGTGYGLPRLQATATWVVGVDVDPVAVESARKEILRDRGEVLVADATHLPFQTGHFGAVTSFETLEHLSKATEFVREIGRVLAPDGVAFISTPNAKYTLPINGIPRNPYHVHEYQAAELVAELSFFFGEVDVLGQRLSARFVVPPFDWDLHPEKDPLIRANIVVRKAVHRLPPAVRDRTSMLLWGHSFFPCESDYRFCSAGAEEASVLVAVCRKPIHDAQHHA